MNKEEYEKIMKLMLNQLNKITWHQQVLAGIKTKLENNKLNPFEQDYIYRKHYGSLPTEPITKEINGIEVTTTILHQTGKRLSDIASADMLYEIQNHKYILIQYKNGSEDTVSVDCRQLDALLGNCPSICHNKLNPPESVPIRLRANCGVYYGVFYNEEEFYVPACEANAIFKSTKKAGIDNFRHGLSSQILEQLFASCRIGALTRIRKSKGFTETLIEQNHMVFKAVQNRKR